MEWFHSKNSNGPAYQGDDDNTNYHRRRSTACSRQNLSAYDAANRAVADHDNNIQHGGQFGWPITHKVARNNLYESVAVPSQHNRAET